MTFDQVIVKTAGYQSTLVSIFIHNILTQHTGLWKVKSCALKGIEKRNKSLKEIEKGEINHVQHTKATLAF